MDLLPHPLDRRITDGYPIEMIAQDALGDRTILAQSFDPRPGVAEQHPRRCVRIVVVPGHGHSLAWDRAIPGVDPAGVARFNSGAQGYYAVALHAPFGDG